MEKVRFWQDDYITQKDGWFIALDETRTTDIGTFSTIELARDALTHYSNQLDGNLDNDNMVR